MLSDLQETNMKNNLLLEQLIPEFENAGLQYEKLKSQAKGKKANKQLELERERREQELEQKSAALRAKAKEVCELKLYIDNLDKNIENIQLNI